MRKMKGGGKMGGKMKGGTRVRATWAQCTGVKGKVRLKAGIDSTCKRMWGTISTKRGKSKFDAELSLCGNGVVDSGEQCDGAACSNGYPCGDACECDLDGVPGPGCTPGVDCPAGGVTSTTVAGGGGTTTSTSLANGMSTSTTSTSIGGGATTTTTLPGDHFKCYKLRASGFSFRPGPVSLVDQFGAAANVAEEPERLCNPVDKEGEGVTDPTAHLMCYDLQKQPGFVRQDHVVRNQFGDQILTVIKPESLCMRAEKDGVDSPLNLNNFKCYRVAQRHGKFAQRIVTLADQFETKSTVVQKPLLLCNPVDANGAGVVDPAGHLTCYRIVDADGQGEFAPRQVSVGDQFTEQLVTAFRGTCRKASMLCVPSLKDPSAASTTTTFRPTTTSTSSTTSTTVRGTTTSTSSTTSTTVRGTTTSTSSTTSTTVRGTTTSTSSTTSTSIAGTTSTSIGGTSTSTSSTSSTSVATPTTTPPTTSSTTSTSSTSSTTAGAQCCNNATNLRFLTANAPGDCGDIIDAGGMVVANVNCAGLYTGGGGNSVPLPFAVPDLGDSITAITTCSNQIATIGPTTSAETGSKKNCSSAGCFFGAPLAVPNPGSTPTSVCVTNTLSDPPLSGTVNCDTGATSLSAPLSSVIFLTGDTATDPGSTITGIQPCPLCSGGDPMSGTCVGGPNAGLACVKGTTTLNPSYPTSHDCPPDPMFNIGTLPVAFSLSTGTVAWTGTPATNDTGSTTSVQSRVFSGFCRDVDGTGAFAGSTAATAQLCWENGMAVGAACSGTFEGCEQKSNGAFGPSGGANRTIRAIGNAMSLSGGSAAATLVSVFSIRPTFDPTVDAAGDLPGPGAVALPGVASLCNNAMCTP
jgi:hypothetical protein